MELSYASTVPRQLVHRQSVGEVFLTDYRLSDFAADQIAVQLPASHRVFRPTHERHDPLIVAEAFRQAVMLLCHSKYGVPPQFKFLMERFRFEILDMLEVRSAPMSLVFDMSTNHLTERGGTLSRIEISGILREEQRILARCSAVARCVDPTSYHRIRAGRELNRARFRSTPLGSVVVPGRCVGRAEEQDVVIAADLEANEVYCTPDPRNYALFDHPLDHIPGMVVFDAAIQAVRYLMGDPSLQLSRLTASFPAFTEWDAPCRISVAPPGAEESAHLCVTLVQSSCLTTKLDIATTKLPEHAPLGASAR
ncbi:hypothetical protein SRABI91_02971 [Rhodococcoides fascians]|nr:hypothetical protein SRABI91_02971 [Rhodococcus fascians]